MKIVVILIIGLFTLWAQPSPKNTKFTKINLKQEFRLGGETEGEDYLFSSIGFCTEDDQGNLYLMDAKDHKIKVFDKSGKFLYDFGKDGKGPGELLYPTVSRIKNNKIYIKDANNPRISVFDLKGKFLSSFLIPKMIRDFDVVNDGIIITREIPSGEIGLSENEIIIEKINFEGKTVSRLYSEILKNIWVTKNAFFWLNFGFEIKWCLLPDQTIMVINTETSILQKIDQSGKILSTIDLGMKTTGVKASDFKVFYPRKIDKVPVEKLLASETCNKLKPTIKDIWHNNGIITIQTYSHSDNKITYLQLDASGKILKKFALPAEKFTGYQIHFGNTIYTYVPGVWDYPEVVKYKIQ